MPGVTYQREVQFTSRGPVVLDVVTAPQPDGSLYTLASRARAQRHRRHGEAHRHREGRERGRDRRGRERRLLRRRPRAADRDRHAGRRALVRARGRPVERSASRAAGMLTVAQVAFDGTWRGTSQRRQLDLNDPPVAGHTTLYTSAWGPATPPEEGVVADVIASLPPLQPNHVIAGVVTEQDGAGGIPIPPGGAVLVARGAQAPHLSAEAPPGTTVEIRPTLTPDWSSQLTAIGGGPQLVSGGKAVFRTDESFGDSVLNTRGARSAVGQTADGHDPARHRRGRRLRVQRRHDELRARGCDGPARRRHRDGPRERDAGRRWRSTARCSRARPRPRTPSPRSPTRFCSRIRVCTRPRRRPPSCRRTGTASPTRRRSPTSSSRPSQVTVTLTGPDGATLTLAQDAEQPGLHTIVWNGQPTTRGAVAVRGLGDGRERAYDHRRARRPRSTTPSARFRRRRRPPISRRTFRTCSPRPSSSSTRRR